MFIAWVTRPPSVPELPRPYSRLVVLHPADAGLCRATHGHVDHIHDVPALMARATGTDASSSP